MPDAEPELERPVRAAVEHAAVRREPPFVQDLHLVARHGRGARAEQPVHEEHAAFVAPLLAGTGAVPLLLLLLLGLFLFLLLGLGRLLFGARRLRRRGGGGAFFFPRQIREIGRQRGRRGRRHGGRGRRGRGAFALFRGRAAAVRRPAAAVRRGGTRLAAAAAQPPHRLLKRDFEVRGVLGRADGERAVARERARQDHRRRGAGFQAELHEPVAVGEIERQRRVRVAAAGARAIVAQRAQGHAHAERARFARAARLANHGDHREARVPRRGIGAAVGAGGIGLLPPRQRRALDVQELALVDDDAGGLSGKHERGEELAGRGVVRH